MSFPWHSWCQFCRKTPTECSVTTFEDLRLDDTLFNLAIKCFSGKAMKRRDTLPICPDCKEFLDQIQNFTLMYAQTHSIYAELRKKCQPEEYALDQQAEAEGEEEEEDEEDIDEESEVIVEELYMRDGVFELRTKSEIGEETTEILEIEEGESPDTKDDVLHATDGYKETKEVKAKTAGKKLSRQSGRKKKHQDFKCDECGQVCASTASLSRHKRNHAKKTETPDSSPVKERPFACEVCDKRWATKGSLKEHMIIHSESRPFKCSHCPKLFKNQQRLRIHEDTHTDTQYKCPLCNLQLNTKRTLTMHMVVHSEVKKFKCEFCSNEFKRAKALKAHLVIHTGLRPYKCQFCEKTFANGSNCRSHKRKAHPEELAAYESSMAEKGEDAKVAKVLPTLGELKNNLITILPMDEDAE